MVSTIIGSKINQSQEFTQEGKRIPVTHIDVGSCFVTHITDTDKKSIQLGYGTIKNLSKAEKGHLQKAGLDTKLRFLKTITVQAIDASVKVGEEIHATDIFQVGDAVRVTGISTGKGFASAIKRHHFKGGPRTHGQSDRERAPGSIGSTTTPGRVFKGQRMAGRLGGDTVTVRGLSIVGIDAEHNIVTIKGLIPGKKHAIVVISKE